MAAQPNRYPTLTWRKSSRSTADGGCVEVTKTEAAVLVRDSRDRPEVILTFKAAQWRRFTRRVKDGLATELR